MIQHSIDINARSETAKVVLTVEVRKGFEKTKKERDGRVIY